MADNYLQTAMNRVRDGQLLMTDPNGDRFVRDSQNHIYPLPTRYPFFINYQGGGTFGRTDQGDPYQGQTWTVTMRYVIGKPGEKITGVLQEQLWVHQVVIPNWFQKYPALEFTGSDGVLDELDPSGTEVIGMTRLGTFQDLPTHLGVEFTLNLKFHVEIEQVWFDG